MAATQTFLKGQFLYLDIAGRLNACATDTAGIAGMAEASYADALAEAGYDSSHATVGIACPITLAKRGQQFTVNTTYTDAGANTTSIDDVGKKAGLYVASNICYADMDHANARFIVDCIAEDNAMGDTRGRVVVEVLDAYAQLDSGTS
jgi:hypothetical protein